ncbi:glutamate-cysteine ligase family protein [Parachlamydia sp. AcF125]|uniref:carboxylate-amine ligase n=1 Tax=Parachlamydia sp. AcF125 TaxID=2795736 RepID=UPI001BC9CD5C|nr:glutamate-cysteine ligase family protein [Parachlamydia sp. AcF125]MBS4169026.1 Glutamate--cysteine ligase [Parachlamydia sp. AcF125]
MSAPLKEEPVHAIWHLFDVFGVELEYMIVDQDSLNILPITDQLFYSVLGEYKGDYEKEPIGWSNELALHVLELKTTHPTAKLPLIYEDFQKEIKSINEYLRAFNGILMPTAMHPWMVPSREMKLWTHDNKEIYAAFNRIFNCQGHGWSNLQSNHLNLPFGNEQEFIRLHAAIRMVLPLIPALAASSPIVEGKPTGLHDTRLNVYRSNSAKIPSITAHIIPEVCRSFNDYKTKIFDQIYQDIAPFDPEKTLQYEWLNARGAITRFNRNAIEIRLIDVQECPKADIAINKALTEVIRCLTQEKWVSLASLHQFQEERLKEILLDTIKQGEFAEIHDREFLQAFGWSFSSKCRAKDLWGYLIQQIGLESDQTLQHILAHGTLSTRLLKGLGAHYSRKELEETYRYLCQNLEKGTLFLRS